MPTDVTTATLAYGEHALEAVILDGEEWLRGHQIGEPLGFADYRSALNLYARNADEFTARDTREVTLPTAGGPQLVRVFSLRGVRLLGFLAGTPEAKAFRKWALDRLEALDRAEAMAAAIPPAVRPVVTSRGGRRELTQAEFVRYAREQGLAYTGAIIEAGPAAVPFAQDYIEIEQQIYELNRAKIELLREARDQGVSKFAVRSLAQAQLVRMGIRVHG